MKPELSDEQESLIRAQTIYTSIKIILVLIVCVILVIFGAKVFSLVEKYDEKVDRQLDKIGSVIDHVELAAKAGEETMVRHREFIIDQQTKFNDPGTQTAIGLYLRGGRPFYRTILALESTLKEANSNLSYLRGDTLPAATAAISGAGQVLSTANQALGNLDAATADFQALTSDPALINTLHNLERGTSELAASSEQTKLILMDTRNDLPRLFAAGIGTAENVQAFTGEAVTFAKRVNKPKTKLERVLGIGIEAGFRALPSVIAR